MAIFSRKKAKHTRNYKFLMDLPSEILLEILSRVHAKSVFVCKCVCKEWLEIITSPGFVELHLSRSRPGLVVHYTEMFRNYLRLVDFEEGAGQHGVCYDPDAKFKPAILSSFTDSSMVVDGSVNGFLFLRDVNYKHETLYICNPLTREYIVLPKPNSVVCYPNVVTHGFGVSSISGHYKIVRIFQERELDTKTGDCLRVLRSKAQVYTLGTGEWRDVFFGEVSFAYSSYSIGLFFKGKLHWLIQDLEGSELISCFDLENEFFQPFPSPFPGKKLLGSLGVLGGCLCLTDNTSQIEIDIWVMKEYGVRESWVKEISISNILGIVGPAYEAVCALKVFGDGVISLLWGDSSMLFYSSKSETAQQVDLNQTRGPNSIEAMHHVSSLLSLRNFEMESVYSYSDNFI